MRYENEDLGFSFELPHGWRRDEHNLTLTLYGPNRRPGLTSEVIQIQIGGIAPDYVDPLSRERFLAEPGGQISRSKVGDETNVVVLRKSGTSEISVVRDGIHYTIGHANDSSTDEAVECLKKTARFPLPEQASAAIHNWSNPKKQALGRVLSTGSPEEARQILSEAGMPASVQRPGYTVHHAHADADTRFLNVSDNEAGVGSGCLVTTLVAFLLPNAFVAFGDYPTWARLFCGFLAVSFACGILQILRGRKL